MRNDIIFGMEKQHPYELLVKQGDFVIGRSEIQEARHIITAHPGVYKQWPLLGAGIGDDINSSMDASLLRRIQLHLRSDGLKASSLKIRDNSLVVRL